MRKQITIYLDEDLYFKVRQLAQDDIRSVTNYIETLIKVSIESGRDLKSEMNPFLTAGIAAKK